MLIFDKMEQTIHTKYTIEIISEDYSESVNQFLKKYYIGYDPVTEYLLNENNDLENKSTILNSSYFDINKEAIREGHCLMALTSSGDIIGVMMNEKLQDEIVYSNPYTKILLDKVNKKMDEIVKCDNELLWDCTTVHCEFLRRGIAKALLLRTIDHARRAGFDQIRVHCTSEYSARLSESCGFQYVYSLAYKDFKPNGKVVLKPKFPHTHVHGMILRL